MARRGFKTVLVADIGAGSGKVYAAGYDGSAVRLQKAHHFKNSPVLNNGSLLNNVGVIMSELKTGFLKAAALCETPPEALAVDTFGNDYALLGPNLGLVASCYSYRDPRTAGFEEKLKTFPGGARSLYGISGIAPAGTTAISQLMAYAESSGSSPGNVRRFLMLADYLGYLLSGESTGEYTACSTSSIMDAKARRWSPEIINFLPLPKDAYPEITQPGTTCGYITAPELKQILGMKMRLAKAAGHDSASAVVPIPLRGDCLYISSGSWSLLGAETEKPIINDMAFRFGLNNQGMPERKNRFQKSLPGLWVMQQYLAELRPSMPELTFAEIEQMAAEADCASFVRFVNFAAPEFLAPGPVAERIRGHCEMTGQPPPETPAETARCIYESLAALYAVAKTGLEAAGGGRYRIVYVVGGGAQDSLLAQMTADALEIPVRAGLPDASALGNALMQLVALGELSGLAQARALTEKAGGFATFEPRPDAGWRDYIERAKKSIGAE
jgi:sugar (pentulose or hexulose) kinase